MYDKVERTKKINWSIIGAGLDKLTADQIVGFAQTGQC